MKYLVAVSGGVDSVVLLDMLAKAKGSELIVAHFDHGIRNDSADDAAFVKRLAASYGIPFETKREALGKDAGEELARERRYTFLRAMAEKHTATIVTAHHMNDIAETIAINVARGTGWRGVAVLASDIYRPLLTMTKEEIMAYAKLHSLVWREDSTNATDAYLRNRLRRKLVDEDVVLQLAALRARQVELRDAIDSETMKLVTMAANNYSRYFYTHIPQSVAVELLRTLAVISSGRSLPRPHLERSLLAIKTARAGARFPFGSATLIVGRKTFSLSVKTP